MSEAGPSRAQLVESFRFQARGCAAVGSPVYAELLARAADDLERGGLFASVVDGFPGHPILSALPLRVMGAVHRLALAGRAPEIAAFFPSTGGRFEPEPAWQALLAVVEAHRDELRSATRTQVQTNEVRRCAALLGGFLRVARATGLPLRLREIGSCAGLNLLFDRYRYELGRHRWGERTAPLAIAADWEGAAPDLGAPLRVASRAGCDVAPVDVCDREQRLRLESFVWPDQVERLARVRAALALARAAPPPIETARAGPWIAAQLAAPVAGEATVLFHSVVWWYLPAAERQRIDGDVRAAGARARPDAPLAWLRFEGVTDKEAEVRLLLWPGGEDRLLGCTHWHGAWVRWEVV